MTVSPSVQLSGQSEDSIDHTASTKRRRMPSWQLQVEEPALKPGRCGYHEWPMVRTVWTVSVDSIVKRRHCEPCALGHAARTCRRISANQLFFTSPAARPNHLGVHCAVTGRCICALARGAA
eukprot:362856-Chlamydomonas_euryale.AAC.8